MIPTDVEIMQKALEICMRTGDDFMPKALMEIAQWVQAQYKEEIEKLKEKSDWKDPYE